MFSMTLFRLMKYLFRWRIGPGPDPVWAYAKLAEAKEAGDSTWPADFDSLSWRYMR